MKKYTIFELRNKDTKIKSLPITKSLEERLMNLPNIVAITIAIVGITGLTSMLLFAPNSLQLLKRFIYKKYNKRCTNKQLEQKFTQTVYYLKKRGLIEIGDKKNNLWLKLTNLGKTRHKKYLANHFYIQKPERWDHTFWLVAADIPSKTHRLAGDALHRKLINSYFYPLQRTIWLYPYNPKEVLQDLLEGLGLSKFVTLMHVSELDKSDEKLVIDFWKAKEIV